MKSKALFKSASMKPFSSLWFFCAKKSLCKIFVHLILIIMLVSMFYKSFAWPLLAWCMTCILIFFVEITILEPVLIRYLAFRTLALFEKMPYHDA